MTKPKTHEVLDILEFSEGYIIELEDDAARGDPKAAEMAVACRFVLDNPWWRHRLLEAAARIGTPKQYNKVRTLEEFDKLDVWGNA